VFFYCHWGAVSVTCVPFTLAESNAIEAEMELIKQIKQAEAESQQIVEQAKAEAAGGAEESRSRRGQLLQQAEQARKKAVARAVAEARSQGQAEVANLNIRADRDRDELRDSVREKMAGATAKVMEYLRG